MKKIPSDSDRSGFTGKRYHLPAISALLFFASIYPSYLLVPNFIFLIPLLFYIKDVANGREALKGGMLFGLIAYGAIFHWIYALFRISFFLPIFLYLLIVLYLSLASAVFVFLAYFILSRWKIKFFLFMPFLWIVAEQVRTLGPFRFTSDHAAYSMAIFPQLIQFIDITGPYGITFWLILVNALIFETIVSFPKKSSWIRYAIAATLAVLLPASFSYYRWTKLIYTPDLKISMIQPNIPLEKKLKKGYETENRNITLSLTSEALRENPDIVIWPETSYPDLLLHWLNREVEPSLPEISQYAHSSRTPILVGANYVRIRSKEDFDIYNAALLVDSGGHVNEHYGKMYLVPFTESVPFKRILGLKKAGRKGLLAQLANFSSGDRFSIFKIERQGRHSPGEQQAMEKEGRERDEKLEKFGVLICYEGLFSELSRQFRKDGVDFLVSITNDAWFGKTFVPYWHASALRLRAIENRISIARCANTGVSCFFDPAGRMSHSSEIFTRTIVTGSILAAPPLPPFYTRSGNVIVYISYAAVLLVIILATLLRKKARPRKK